MIDNFILVSGQYEGGSTLMMRILNGFKGFNIYGENSMAIQHLCDFYNKMENSYKIGRPMNYYGDKIKPAWYNEIDLEKIKVDVRNTILNIYTKKNFKNIGFKEIRYGIGHYNYMEENILCLKKIIPETKVIFVYRDRSEDNEKNREYFSRSLDISMYNSQIENFKKFNLEFPDLSFILEYSEISDKINDSKIRSMCDFLQIKYNRKSLINTLKLKL